MKTTRIEAFEAIGISVRTTNEQGQSAQDIGALWGRFMSEGIAGQIPAKIDSTVLSIYTNYESDHSRPYDAILACKVAKGTKAPEGMVSIKVEGGDYSKSTCQGDLTKGAVYGAWEEILSQDLDRTYAADFEVYDERAQNPTQAEVDVMVGINSPAV